MGRHCPDFLRPHLAARYRHHRRRPPVPHRARAALLQRRRGLRAPGPAHRRAGGAQGGPAARRTGRGRRRRGGPSAAGARRAGAADRAAADPRGARLVHRSATTTSWSLEYIDGQAAEHLLRPPPPADRAPIPTPAVLAEYTQWALRVHGLVEEAVEAIHARGRGLQRPAPVQHHGVAEDEASVVAAGLRGGRGRRRRAAARRSPTPASWHRADRRGFDVDRYALACLRLALFLPLTSLLRGGPRARRCTWREIAAEQFPVPRAFLDEAVRGDPARRRRARRRAARPGRRPAATDYLPVGPADWPRSRDSMARAILASATPDREDRLLPRRHRAVRHRGRRRLLRATARPECSTRWPRPAPDAAPRREEWLLRRPRARRPARPLGFYDGLAGVAWTLDRLGHRERALALVDRIAAAGAGPNIAPDLHSGLAGLGLALDALGRVHRRDARCGTAALRCAELVAGSTDAPRRPRAPRTAAARPAPGCCTGQR